MTDLNGVKYISDEMYYKENLIEELLNNVYDSFSTNYNDYVENFNNSLNVTYPFKLQDILNESNVYEYLYKNYLNLEKNVNYSDKIKGLSGYVENFVDNMLKKEEYSELIHSNYDFSENSMVENNLKSFNESIKNIDNNQHNENNSYGYGININMGGITQNITESNCDDIMDMLVEKLRDAVASGSSRLYG